MTITILSSEPGFEPIRCKISKSPAFRQDTYDINDENLYKDLLKYIDLNGKCPQIEDAIALDGFLSCNYAERCRCRFPKGEKAILKNPITAYNYAIAIIGKPWPEAADIISSDIGCAYNYCKYVIKGPWRRAEKIFLTDPIAAYYYAVEVLQRQWPRGEKIILSHPDTAYYYAKNIIKGRIPAAEAMILKDQNPNLAYEYARDVIKGRWIEAEPIIMKSALIAYKYALGIIKGRWPEAEKIIEANIAMDIQFKLSHNYWTAVDYLEGKPQTKAQTKAAKEILECLIEEPPILPSFIGFDGYGTSVPNNKLIVLQRL